MANGIESKKYICSNGQELNTGIWWTTPIQDLTRTNEFFLCGGNVASQTGAGHGNNTCVFVNIDTCETKEIGKMIASHQDLRPICTLGYCLLFGGNTDQNAGKNMPDFDLFDRKNRRLESHNDSTGIEQRLCYAADMVGNRAIITGGYGKKDPATQKGPVLKTAVVSTTTGEAKTINMTHERGGHSLTKLPGDKFLLLGGNGTDSSGAEIFDFWAEAFTPVAGKMKCPRKDHRAILANDGLVYIIGGSGKDGSPVEIETFDPATQTFGNSGLSLSEGREDAAVVYIQQHDIIVAVGGEIKGRAGEPESKAIDVIDLKNHKVFSGSLTAGRDEPFMVVKNIDGDKITLLVLTGQRKDASGREYSLPAEEITIDLSSLRSENPPARRKKRRVPRFGMLAAK
ncbi:MAG: hypothetical protein HYT75_02925 [Deltaproteobacteria bacterium]|nr:hypothetical protein [Deltaproteobacteria bacterium]MBI2341166.1 hypothetical protein [Deltaproteobacteria bacterium]